MFVNYEMLKDEPKNVGAKIQLWCDKPIVKRKRNFTHLFMQFTDSCSEELRFEELSNTTDTKRL